MPNPIYREKFRNPALVLSDMLARHAQGQFWDKSENIPTFKRALVIGVDPIGGMLENPGGNGKMTFQVNGQSYDVAAVDGPENPQNSIKGRVMNDGEDQFMDDSRLRIFWPMFPEHDQIPIKPGEYVYVFFEDDDQQVGTWVSKVPDNQNVNYFPGDSNFQSSSAGSLHSMDPQAAGVGDSDDPPNDDDTATQSDEASPLAKAFGDAQ
ncbi:MAG: hypothetical protein ACYDHY_07450 [Acidiferrobacterales bacterium]